MKNKWLVFVAVGLEIAAAVIAGLVIGNYADKRAGTQFPYFTFFGLLAGTAAGLLILIKVLKIDYDRK